ncbi:peptidase M28-like protein [Litorimonas taeanensis]|uniref:Peptidase M28-like protein n=1 Tax=Litorimonas taeanensis TaxID=568099 RepID=A0A420WE23_9PROT|nr:M28 family peptidase [Litorimonas taeanensis]RKQ69160.1 peptidase M28-like protein [Litorimonas taeanensis]
MRKILALPILAALSACSPIAPEADMQTALRVFETLSADDMQGRATGTEGGNKARAYLKTEIKTLKVFDETSAEVFTFTPRSRDGAFQEDIVGENLIGLIDIDDKDQGPILIITAHYDHLGQRGDDIYNGADDNASGSAALFAIAESFKKQPPQHDIAFVWLDAEERGLSGARAYVSANNNFKDRPAFNLNLDMVSQNQDELYFAGSYHLPALKPLMEKAGKNTGLTLSFGHDRPEEGPNDWTLQSDHGAFHAVSIPFGYFGVEDHPHYHRPSDTFDSVPLAFYESSVQTLINAAHILDDNLENLARKGTEIKPAQAE